ncbi:hypothetical protein [Caloranaerobacter azorensis]|uniref:Uncharacterized protein n=1 Tax=Caloranaerobacter azorensis TaxID=116090 RepID=A0A6P1YEC4_9FIRM|nr:hypothetical protein [Caloranaerobacter azorensis]QIB27427.1 hypothetical protein G3A45_09085 [Caloranaerobacter azorensis]
MVLKRVPIVNTILFIAVILLKIFYVSRLNYSIGLVLESEKLKDMAVNLFGTKIIGYSQYYINDFVMYILIIGLIFNIYAAVKKDLSA